MVRHHRNTLGVCPQCRTAWPCLGHELEQRSTQPSRIVMIISIMRAHARKNSPRRDTPDNSAPIKRIPHQRSRAA